MQDRITFLSNKRDLEQDMYSLNPILNSGGVAAATADVFQMKKESSLKK